MKRESNTDALLHGECQAAGGMSSEATARAKASRGSGREEEDSGQQMRAKGYQKKIEMLNEILS